MTKNKKVNWLFLIIVVLYILMSLGAGMLSGAAGMRMPVYVSILLSEVMIVVPCLIYCKINHISILKLIPFRKMKFSVCVLVIVCTYLLYPLMMVLNALTLFFVESGTTGMVGGLQNGSFLIAALFMGVLPALTEEFAFRGIIFQTYRNSRMLPAILISGFMFGCMHMNFNQFLYAFVLGIFLAFLVEATGSIFSAILAHFTLNFTSVVMSFLMKDIVNADVQGMQQEMMGQSGNFLATMDSRNMIFLMLGILIWAAIAIGTTAGAAGVYIGISKISGRWEHVKTMFRHKSGERIITIPLVAALALTVAIMVWSAVR